MFRGNNSAHLQELQTVQYSLWYVVPNTLPVGGLVTYWVQHTISCIAQSKAPEDGQNFWPETCRTKLDLSINHCCCI